MSVSDRGSVVVTRKPREGLQIGEDIFVHVLKSTRGATTLRIKAPESLRISRLKEKLPSRAPLPGVDVGGRTRAKMSPSERGHAGVAGLARRP